MKQIIVLVSSLLFLHVSAQGGIFNTYPACVREILFNALPPNCADAGDLIAETTCLCNHANALASDSVKSIYERCGCADLESAIQLSDSYCLDVGINVGSLFLKYEKQDTNCNGGSGGGSGSSTPSPSPSASSSSTPSPTPANTPTSTGGASPTTASPTQSSTPGSANVNSVPGQIAMVLAGAVVGAVGLL